jgi:hypothetical protein
VSSTDSSAFRDRLPSAVLALALQAAFIAAFLHALPPMAPPKQLARELVFILPRLAPKPLPGPPQMAPRATSLPVFVPPPLFSLPAPSASSPNAPSTAVQNFGRAVFGCAPETYSSLTPQQRAQCLRPGEGVAIQEVPNLMGSPSHVKDEAHWQEEWAREQSPALLPCGGFIDIMCLLTKIATGTLSDYGDPRQWPHYAVQQLAPEDFYKVEQAYDAWHKAHDGKKNAASDAPAP